MSDKIIKALKENTESLNQLSYDIRSLNESIVSLSDRAANLTTEITKYESEKYEDESQ